MQKQTSHEKITIINNHSYRACVLRHFIHRHQAKVQIAGNTNSTPVDLVVDGKRYESVVLPTTVKINRGYKSSHLEASALGYEKYETDIDKKFNPVAVANLTNILAWGIDAATGAVTKPESNYYYIVY